MGQHQKHSTEDRAGELKACLTGMSLGIIFSMAAQNMGLVPTGPAIICLAAGIFGLSGLAIQSQLNKLENENTP